MRHCGSRCTLIVNLGASKSGRPAGLFIIYVCFIICCMLIEKVGPFANKFVKYRTYARRARRAAGVPGCGLAWRSARGLFHEWSEQKPDKTIT